MSLPEGAIPSLNGAHPHFRQWRCLMVVECVCAHAVLGADQTKVLGGNKPVKRTTLATN